MEDGQLFCAGAHDGRQSSELAHGMSCAEQAAPVNASVAVGSVSGPQLRGVYDKVIRGSFSRASLIGNEKSPGTPKE
jgi:hypothetical protein